MKCRNYSYKLRYKRYLKLIYRCLLNKKYIKLTHMGISHGDITRIYRKTHMVVVKVIPKIEITKLILYTEYYILILTTCCLNQM